MSRVRHFARYEWQPVMYPAPNEAQVCEEKDAQAFGIYGRWCTSHTNVDCDGNYEDCVLQAQHFADVPTAREAVELVSELNRLNDSE